MSTRTIIEINHDYLYDLAHEPEHLAEMIRALQSCDLKRAERNRVPGIRILGQRHHSEPEWQQGDGSADSLHRDIMNLRCQVPPMVVDDQAYKLGHRDARHAAAELALSAGMAGRE